MTTRRTFIASASMVAFAVAIRGLPEPAHALELSDGYPPSRSPCMPLPEPAQVFCVLGDNVLIVMQDGRAFQIPADEAYRMFWNVGLTIDRRVMDLRDI